MNDYLDFHLKTTIYNYFNNKIDTICQQQSIKDKSITKLINVLKECDNIINFASNNIHIDKSLNNEKSNIKIINYKKVTIL